MQDYSFFIFSAYGALILGGLALGALLGYRKARKQHQALQALLEQS